MIKNLVFDLGNVLIEWNSEKILTYFEPEKERRQVLRQAIFESGVWHKTDKGELSLKEACEEVLTQLVLIIPQLRISFIIGMRLCMFTVVYRKGFGYGLIKVIESISCQPLVRFFIILKKLVCCPFTHCCRAISFPQRSVSSSQK
mgnify:CR=1 FL=1